MKSNFKHNLGRLRKMVNSKQSRAEYYATFGLTPPKPRGERKLSRKGSAAGVRDQATEQLRAKITRLERKRLDDQDDQA